MSLIKFDRRLTGDPATDLFADTHEGQAHAAGSGPTGRTCKECLHWGAPGGAPRHSYWSGGSKHGPRLKPHNCGKYRSLMRGVAGPEVPHDAKACKYFEQAESPPSVFNPRDRG
jgi:hypothetical protein